MAIRAAFDGTVFEVQPASQSQAGLDAADPERYGLAEFWVEAAGGGGDCEDHALAKRDALLATGASYADLRVLALQNERGQWRAVLAVQTAEGEWILDNRYPNPQRRENLARFPGYHFEATFLMSDP
jgi:predicted transglutaminase-like cysteine proteinase